MYLNHEGSEQLCADAVRGRICDECGQGYISLDSGAAHTHSSLYALDLVSFVK
jgi:hypothetical protein